MQLVALFVRIPTYVQEIYPSQGFRTSMTASPSPKEATSAFTSTHFLLRRIELRGCQFFSPSFIRDNSFLYFLIIPTNTEDLPRANDPIV